MHEWMDGQTSCPSPELQAASTHAPFPIKRINFNNMHDEGENYTMTML